eukprot:SAG31_NODE_3293_length_4452_cov_5.458534_6_plen_132_part_01
MAEDQRKHHEDKVFGRAQPTLKEPQPVQQQQREEHLLQIQQHKVRGHQPGHRHLSTSHRQEFDARGVRTAEKVSGQNAKVHGFCEWRVVQIHGLLRPPEPAEVAGQHAAREQRSRGPAGGRAGGWWSRGGGE